MSILARQFSVVGLASATSANGAARNGATLNMTRVQPGTCLAEITGSTTTTSVIPTYKWVGSMDSGFATTFDIRNEFHAAVVAYPVGTNSPVAYTDTMTLPMAASAYRFVRMIATLAGAATVAADVTQVTYRFVGLGAL